jgi:hypothetical protein
MPSGPKWDGKNRHARDAAARDEEKRSTAKAQEARAKEDALWADDGSSKKKSDAKKEEAAARAEEQRLKKEQAKREYEQEQAALSKGVPAKVAKRDEQKAVTKNIVAGSLKPGGRDVSRVNVAEGNPNRPIGAGAAGDDDGMGDRAASSGAGGADKAKAQSVPDDRHIGKRARTAYRKFCAEQLPMLKEDKKLRRSQHMDLLWAMWQKCPDNPFVQRAENRADEMLRRKWFEEEGSDGDDAAEE